MRNDPGTRLSARALVTMILVQTTILSCPVVSWAILDPAVVYCRANGYELDYEEGQFGPLSICVLPNGDRVNATEFVAGKVALEWSYCARNGLDTKVVDRSDQCNDCLLCVLESGQEVEVTKLMELSFNETTCGDGSCGIPENALTCPADCSPGGWDGLCQRNLAGIVDPDCDTDAIIFTDGFENR